jgi:predicted transcriptional regulator
MSNATATASTRLSELEQLVMEQLWAKGTLSAESCREAMASAWPMKDSTVRTILRRLEAKGYVTHEVLGRTYLYRATRPRPSVAAAAVKSIIDRFCGGSIEQLLVGLVDNDVLDRRELRALAQKIARRKGGKP